MAQYTILQVGLGERGMVHLRSYLEFPDRLRVVGICDLSEPLVQKVGQEYGIERIYTDTETALKELRPDILSFVTPPAERLNLVKLAVKYQVRGMLFEKPMATSLEEAKEIVALCRQHGIKTAVCHQHKYLEAFQAVKRAIDSGELGRIERITGETASQFSLNGTHYMD